MVCHHHDPAKERHCFTDTSIQCCPRSHISASGEPCDDGSQTHDYTYVRCVVSQSGSWYDLLLIQNKLQLLGAQLQDVSHSSSVPITLGPPGKVNEMCLLTAGSAVGS